MSKDNPLHPKVREMISKGWFDEVAILAAYGRTFAGPATKGQSNVQVASTMLRLQDQGFITMQYNEENDEMAIVLHTDDEQ